MCETVTLSGTARLSRKKIMWIHVTCSAIMFVSDNADKSGFDGGIMFCKKRRFLLMTDSLPPDVQE